MKKLIAIISILLLALTTQAKMHPYFTTTTNWWMNKTNFYSIYDGISERYMASETPNYTTQTIITNPPLVPTNRFWAYDYAYRNSQLGGYQYYPEADEQLYELVTKYAYVTNLTIIDGFFDGMNTTNVLNWSYKSMYNYLQDNFTNTDGTVGVGIYTNYPNNTSSNWFWTLSWETNEWNITLGSLTFAVTNIYYTNGLTHITAGWIYQDADRIVRKPLSSWSGPPEWSITPSASTTNDINSRWWICVQNNGFDTWWDWHKFGRMFDYVDMSGISNSITFKTGTTNWSNLATNLNLKIMGHTNYSSVWNSGGWYRQVTDWVRTNYDVSIKSTSDIVNVKVPIFDLGGYSNEVHSGLVPVSSYPTNWFDGLSISNTEDWTSGIPVTNHLGDTITLKMYSKSRLYKWPQDPGHGLWRTIPSLNPFIDNRELNEKYAILQLLRAVQFPSKTFFYFDFGYNHGISGQSGGRMDDVSWPVAKVKAVNSWPTNLSLVDTPVISHASYGAQLDDGKYRAEVWAERTIPILEYQNNFNFTGDSFRIDWYLVPTNETRRFWESGTQVIPAPFTTVFDDNGETNCYGDLITFMDLNYMNSSNVPINFIQDIYGPWIGGNTNVLPNWCDMPTPGTPSVKGWGIENCIGIKYWNFNYCTNSFEVP